MAETPPPGSLLSNFIFGSGRRRPPSGPTSYSGSSSGGRPQLPSEQIAEQTAMSLSDPARQAAEAFLVSLKSELSGKKVIKQFGGEDDIVEMDHEVVSKAVIDNNGMQPLQDLGLANPEDFKKHYLKWRNTQQEQANKEMSELFGQLRAKQITKEDYQSKLRKFQGDENFPGGKKPHWSGLVNAKGLAAEGLGKYQVEYDNLSLAHPLQLIGSIGKNITAREAQLFLAEVNPLSGEFANVPYLNKLVESRVLTQFVADRIASAYQEVQDSVTNKTYTDPVAQAKEDRLRQLEKIVKNTPQASRNKTSFRNTQRELAALDKEVKGYWVEQQQLAARLKDLQDQEERDANEPDPSKRTGLKSKIEKAVQERLRNKILDAVSKSMKEYNQLRSALRNPFRHFIWNRGYFWGKERGFNLSARFLKLSNAFWGKIPLGRYLRLGATGLIRKGAGFLGKYAGKLLKKGIGSLARSTLGVALRTVVTAAVSAVLGAASAVGAAIAAALGISLGTIGIVVFLVSLILLIVLFPFATQRQAAGAAIPPGLLPIKSQLLLNYFNDLATQSCVPPAMLLALARREAGGTFNFTDADVTKFSTPNWWVGASEAELKRGYCYNTCSDPTLECAPGSDVQGPMQFEAGTFSSYAGQVSAQFGHPANRCNLQDSIYAAALKVKANSGTGAGDCGGWSEGTVRQVAQRYCGSCDAVACGGNYCNEVVRFYKSYIALGGGNSSILQALGSTSKLAGGWCGAYVDNVLAAAGLERIGSTYAVDFYADAPAKGYSVFPGSSVEPKPGDIVVFRTGEDLLGRPGHIDFVAAVDSNYIYLTGNDYDLMPYRRNGNSFAPPPGADSTHLQQVGIIRTGTK